MTASGPLERMKLVAVTLLALVGLALTGCGKKEPVLRPPATSGAPSAPASAAGSSPAPSASAATLVEFTVDGAGPYQLGETLATLKAAGSVTEVQAGGEGCPENTTARGTGTWADIRLSFRKDGVLYLTVNRSASIPTPSGAWLGTTVTELRQIYKGVTGEDLARGPSSAYLVTTLSGRGILFELDAAKKVTAMMAGDARYLRSTYQAGTAFC